MLVSLHLCPAEWAELHRSSLTCRAGCSCCQSFARSWFDTGRHQAALLGMVRSCFMASEAVCFSHYTHMHTHWEVEGNFVRVPLSGLQSFSNPRWRLVAPLQQHSHVATEYADLDPVIPELSKPDVQSNTVSAQIFSTFRPKENSRTTESCIN